MQGTKQSFMWLTSHAMSNNRLVSAKLGSGPLKTKGGVVTCDQGCVVLATGHLADTPPPEVLHMPRQARLEDEGAVAQLAILTKAEGEDVVLWMGSEH